MIENSKKTYSLCNSDKKNTSCNKVDKNCCCDIDTLRKILDIFQRENIIVSISTDATSVIGVIFDLTEDVAYVSELDDDGRPDYIIPLCNIIDVSVDIAQGDLRNEIKEEIEDLIGLTSNTNPCCCSDGIADAINDVRRFSDPGTLLCIKTAPNIPSPCYNIADILKANDDVVFIDSASLLVIIPTCQIDSLRISSAAVVAKQN